MTERPIIFSTDMVRAILDGKKTQTRRVIKPCSTATVVNKNGQEEHPEWVYTLAKCPYGQVGDRLWVREAFAKRADGIVDQIMYREQYYNLIKMLDLPDVSIRWKPSIHMFRKDSRIDLEITEVRVERVQEITEGDAIAEGIPPFAPDGEERRSTIPRKHFSVLWDSINAKRGYGWAVNSWVWVISFKRLI